MNGIVLEQDVPSEKLSQYAPERPHVYLVVVPAAQDDLGGAVGAGLHVGREVVVDEAATTKVNHFNLGPGVALDKYILRLQITVYEPKPMYEIQRSKYLLGYLLQTADCEILLFLHFPIVLAIFVEVISQQLCDDEKMFFVVEVVIESQQILIIEALTVLPNVSKQLDLVNALVEIVLVVLDDFHADHLLRVDVVALDGLREGRTAEVFYNLIATGDDGVYHYREFLGLLKSSLLPIKHYTEVVAVVYHPVKFSRIEYVV